MIKKKLQSENFIVTANITAFSLLTPNASKTYLNHAKRLSKKNRYIEAEKMLKKAIVSNPKDPSLYAKIARIYADFCNFHEALICYKKSLAIDPNHARSQFGESICLLTLGKFLQGWEKYRCRFDYAKEQNHRYNFKTPIWHGESLTSKSLFVYMEQGIGDMIQFSRYLSLLAQYNNKIIIDSRHPLLELLKFNFPNYEVLQEGEVKDADYYVPLLNLPAIFKTTLETIPYSQGYLSAPKKHQLKNLIAKNEKKLNVGIVWAGNKRYSADYKRSMSLELLKPLLNKRSIQFYSLQVGEHEKDIETFKLQKKLINLAPNIKDFTDTAVLIDQLDLVIAVDTGVAHLAGALNKPTWIMIPFSPDFRWMLDRSDSPWYDSVRLFRQPESGDWESVIENISKALTKVEKDG